MSCLSADVDLAKRFCHAATVQRTQRIPKLEDSVRRDVSVVGGGLAGLSAAIEFADHGHSTVVFKAKEVAWEASGRNGGQALAGLTCDQATIEARRIWRMTFEAIALFQERCMRFNIARDWQNGYLSLAVNTRKGRAMRQRQDHAQAEYAFKMQWIDNVDMPSWIASPCLHSGAFDTTSGRLNALKYSLDHRMLCGGRVICNTSTPRDRETGMQQRMATTCPQLKNTRIDHSWGGFVDIFMNCEPDFGRLKPTAGSGNTKGRANVYYLQGFSGHGLAPTGLSGKPVAMAIDGYAKRFGTFSRIQHRRFRSGKLLRKPALVAGMAHHRLRDML